MACFSQSSGGGGGGANFDAGEGAAFDSSMPDVEMPEASMEAAADAPAEASPVVDATPDVQPDSAPTYVTVVVGGAAGYESGVDVVFGDATGAVVVSMQTTTGGFAAAPQPNVAMATVVFGTAASPQLYTVMGLKPGDTVLVVDKSSLTTFGTPTANLTAVPTSPMFDGGIANYTVQAGGCQGGGLAAPFLLNLSGLAGGPPCVGLGKIGSSFGALFPMIANATDGAGNLLGFAYSKNNGISMPDDAGYSDLALAGTWSTTTAPQTVMLTNPDGGVSPQLTYSEIADGIATPLAPAYMTTNVFPTHVGFPDAVQAEVSYVTTGYSMRTVASAAAPPATSGTVMLDATSLATEPSITGGTATGTPAARPTVSWTLASGDLSAVTGIITMVSFSGATPDGGTQNGTWTVVSPGTSAASLQAPALPAPLAGYAPVAGNLLLLEVYAIDGQTAIPSYSALVPLGDLFPMNACGLTSPYVPALPGVGTAAVVVFVPGIQC